MKYTLRPYQADASDAAVRFFADDANKKKCGLLILPTGCHAKGTRVIMSDGSLKRVEDVIIGDTLLGDDGSPRTVLQLHRGTDEMYRITPNKGNPFVVNGGHILHLYKTNEGKNYPSCYPRYDEISVRDYLKTSNNYKHLHKLHRASRADFCNDECLFEPYFLGLYLGDGCWTNGVNITTQRDEVVSYLKNFAERHHLGFRKAQKSTSNKAASYVFPCSFTSRSVPNPLSLFISSLGLDGKKAGDKFIPLQYKTGTASQRLELLAGLLDTDAYYDQCKNTYEYCSKSLQLAKDVEFVSRFLGLYAQIGKPKVVDCCDYYRVQIGGDLNIIPTKVKIRQGHQRKQKKSALVTGFSVEPVGMGEYYGFTIDGNHLYYDEQFFVHHNSGKSLVIADIASRIDEPLIVLQPSREILEQNYRKLLSYDVFDCSIYSASMGRKEISRITFATIGSVMNHMDDFKGFHKIIIDECHLVNPSGGQYKEFIQSEPRTVVGLTATPYRLYQSVDPKTMGWKFPVYGSMLKFLTRTRPRVFSKVLYYCQVGELLRQGFLAKLRYFDMTILDTANVKLNSTGADYDDRSLFQEMQRVGMGGYTLNIIKRCLRPKSGVPRNGILVFTKFVDESYDLAEALGPICACVSGETPKNEREQILEDFKAGKIKVVCNVGVLTTGFDFPALDTIILARPTMSLALYYQMVGRAIRPFPKKDGWVIDLCGTVSKFGPVEDLIVDPTEHDKWVVFGKNRQQLTNVLFTK